MEENIKYIPGVCNIGLKERQKRLDLAIGGAIFTSGFTFISYVWMFSPFLKLFVIIPAFFAFLGLLQYRNKFCVYYASKQIENANDEIKTKEIIDSIALEKDRAKAFSIILTSSILSILYTIFVVLLV